MDLGLISARYARALLKYGNANNVADVTYRDMLTLAKSYLDVPQLKFTLNNPMLSREEKEKIIVTAVGGNPSKATQQFIRLVLTEGREDMLQFMANSYVTLYRKQQNITNGKLITATPVSQSTETKMKQMVESRTKGTVEFETVIDPDIIGGFILEYDTYRLDSSVANQLRQVIIQLNK